MSEYHFDYKCTSMVDSKNEKALKFSIMQDYEKPSSPMQVMIYIPKSIQRKDLEVAKLYYSENGVDFPDIESDKPYQVLTASELDATNTFFISPASNCSGVGIIALIRKGSDQPKLEDTYRFSINFLKKQNIYYEIKEIREKKLEVKVVYPRILHPIDLIVCFENFRKPLFVKEYHDTAHQVSKGGEVVKLTLPVKQSDMNYERFIVDVTTTNGPDYRLTFSSENGENNFDLYCLVDESEITIEEKTNKEQYYVEPKREKLVQISKCPFCGGPLVINSSDGKTHGCDGNLLENNPIKSAIDKRIVCVKCFEEHRDSVDGAKFLPEDIIKLPVMHTVFVGAKNSGKTMFLASLINLLGKENEFKSTPLILGEISKTFSKRRDNITTELQPEIFAVENGRAVRKKPVHKDANQSRYLLQVNRKVESYTEYDNVKDRISWNPQAYKLHGMGYAFFYDVPGEAFERDKEMLHSFDMADSFIAVIDGNPTDGSINPLISLQKCLDKILNSVSEERKEEIKNMPLAIVFTKMDQVLKDHSDKKLEECLDDNCHIAKEDIASILPKNGKYEGSQLQRHIDNSSYELIHYIKSFSSGGNFNEQLKGFKRCKLFATSALGSNDVLDTDKSVLCRNRPLRLELPLIWLMYQKHLIKK